MNRRSLLAAVVAVGSGLWCAPASAWMGKEIRDWSVDCSNGLTCNMGFADWGAKGVQYVGFERRGGPDAAVALKLRITPDLAPDRVADASHSFSVDGKVMLTLSAKDFRVDEYGSSHLFSDPVRVTALMEAMKSGTSMEATVSGAGRTEVLKVKLSGVMGAMLYIDEAQGRLGRRDALEARGDKAPPTDMVARDITGLDDMPEIVRKDFTESGGACADLEPETIGQFQGFDISVGATRVIAVPCGTGGAYNQPYALYLGYDVIIERVSFPIMNEGRPTTMTTAYNIDFNPLTKTMTSFFKGRGMGDCGEYYNWAFDADANRLELTEARVKGDCDEKEGGPETFPLVWQAKK